MDEKKNDVLKEFFSWIKTIVLAVLLALFITNVIIVNAEVPTASMQSTIMPFDRLIANRLSYIFSDIERGDIIVFRFPDDEEKLFVKRVIGLPGEHVDIIDGKVFVDDVELVEDYVSSPIVDKTRNSSYDVPEGHYFMMGDNRANSDDSRYWDNKYLSEDKVVGKIMFRYYPYPSLVK